MAAAAGKSRPRFIVVLNADDLEKMVTKLKPSLLHTTILLTETSIQNENNVCTLLLFIVVKHFFFIDSLTSLCKST